MLTIIISPYKGLIITADARRMSVYPAFIDRRKQRQRLNECSDLGRVNSVELLLAHQTHLSLNKWRFRELPELDQGIVHFLNHFHERSHAWFDCYAFANLVSGLPQHTKLLARDHWDLSSIGQEPSPGKTVFLMDADKRTFLHAAVYLGRHRFVSVYGAGGRLEFSSLQDMMCDFGAARIYLATPRK